MSIIADAIYKEEYKYQKNYKGYYEYDEYD